MIFRKNLSCNMGSAVSGDDIECILATLILLSGADHLNWCPNTRIHNGFFQLAHIFIVPDVKRVLRKCYQLPGIDHQPLWHSSFVTLLLSSDDLGVFCFLYFAVLHDFLKCRPQVFLRYGHMFLFSFRVFRKAKLDRFPEKWCIFTTENGIHRTVDAIFKTIPKIKCQPSCLSGSISLPRK